MAADFCDERVVYNKIDGVPRAIFSYAFGEQKTEIVYS